MKRSEINHLIEAATKCFEAHGWALPPKPKWDVTDFGLGDWRTSGLVLVNLAEEPEYCEKLMYAQKGMATPSHCHRQKKEDIISRWGTLRIHLWPTDPRFAEAGKPFTVQVNGEPRQVITGSHIDLTPGERITLTQGIYHEFAPVTDECIIGEVSTANDDQTDNYFSNPQVGRYPGIQEDALPIVLLISDK